MLSSKILRDKDSNLQGNDRFYLEDGCCKALQNIGNNQMTWYHIPDDLNFINICVKTRAVVYTIAVPTKYTQVLKLVYIYNDLHFWPIM